MILIPKTHKLHIDLETYSDVDLKKCGLYRYISSPAFEIMLFGFAMDDDPAHCVDVMCGEAIPDWVLNAIFDKSVHKCAYNAAFEWACLSKTYGTLPPSQWRCSMVHALYCGYPGSLEALGKALCLPQDKQKLSVGKSLINYFCKPCAPSKANGGRTRNLPQHAVEKWQTFKEYNCQDVVTEKVSDDYLSEMPVPDFVQKQWETDLLINSRGVAVDMDLTHGALKIGNQVKSDLMAEAVTLSQLQNPNSLQQLKRWLSEETGEEIDTLNKETVSNLLGNKGNSRSVNRMLEIRQELGKTSTKKYDAIEACVCPDGRVRGLLQFYGANRTGRWAGRLVQVQNLPRTYIEALPTARRLIKLPQATENPLPLPFIRDEIKLIFGSVSDTLSQLIRTAFVATPGNVLIDADFSAIEARVISWLAGEKWRLDVFRSHGKIYEASASRMFGVPIERIKKGNPEYALRARGKVAELALGYQGGVGAMRRMDTGHNLDNLSDEEVKNIVDQWREANSKIVDLWYSINDAVISVVANGGYRTVRGLIFAREYHECSKSAYLTITLPSGRKLYYVNPSIGVNRWGNQSIVYYGVEQGKSQWGKIETYGGKITENCVQAIARDCLAEVIERLDAAGFPIVFHVHDEVVIDTPPIINGEDLLNTVRKIMSAPISWAPDLPLNAEGWVGEYFKKD